VRPEDRLALALFGGGSVRMGRDVLRYSLAAGAVDLSLARTGRCPLLVEHGRCLDGLLGAVVAAETDGVLLRAVVRFARGPEPDRLYDLLAQGFPLSLSLGARILHAERTGDDPDGPGGSYTVTHWLLEELSVVVFGKDAEACLRLPEPGEDAAEMVGRMQVKAGDPARAAVRHVLHLDRWEKWGRLTGPKLAVELGLETDTICDALEREVAEHCGRLERDLAA
jgi:hypothetical protein